MVTKHNGIDIHPLTPRQLAVCKRIFRDYQVQTGREPDAWRRLGEAFTAMSKEIYLPSEDLARSSNVPLAATEDMERWHRESRTPRLREIHAIGAFFGVTQADIDAFMRQPVAVPRSGKAGATIRLAMRFGVVALLSAGHRLHIVRAERVAGRIGPLAIDALLVSAWYGGSPGAHRQ